MNINKLMEEVRFYLYEIKCYLILPIVIVLLWLGYNLSEQKSCQT